MKWPYLKEGDIIDIVAPSWGKTETLIIAKKAVEELGFRANMSADIIQLGADNFSSNNVGYRYKDFKRALYSENSKAIWMLQGGYGAMKILPTLLKDKRPEYIKPVIGFSDSTFLLCFLYNIWRIPSIHGPVLSHYQTKAIASFFETKSLLLGEKTSVKYEVHPMNIIAKVNLIEGILIGGNAMLIACFLGTEWQINTENKIIFLEEFDERGYALDRILTHLRQANFFEKLSAIIFGDIIGNKESDGKNLCVEAIDDFVNEINKPVYSIKNIGHGYINNPLPIGEEAEIYRENDKFFLKVQSGGRA